MTRITIDRIVLEGLPHVDPETFRVVLQRELAECMRDAIPSGRVGKLQPLPPGASEDVAKALAASLKEALFER